MIDTSHQAPPLPEERGSGGEVPRPNETSDENSASPYHMYTTDAKRWVKSLKEYARTNRHRPTPAEDHLWQALRGQQLGVRFRRQHAIRQFIVDFVCLTAWLVVEVDGGIHADPAQADYDGGRTHDLQACGFRVLRFTNEEVLADTARVLRVIREHLQVLLP